MSKTSKGYLEIARAAGPLVHAGVLVIDPSIGSASSLPGWAVYMGGELSSSGTLGVDITASIPRRLQQVRDGVVTLIEDFYPAVIVYEQVPVSAHAGRSQVGHASLLMALGAILSVSGPEHWVGIHPASWTNNARPTYSKKTKEQGGDFIDAIEMGWVCIDTARGILESSGTGLRKRQRKRSMSRRTKSTYLCAGPRPNYTKAK